MKVSIITVVYNNAETIKDCIESVLNQDYPEIEYIVVDGKSTDGTIEIINSYSDKITKFISEKDEGIYDAMNKGITLATGEIIGFLNSDDFYPNNHIISLVVEYFKNNDIDCVYGDLEYVNRLDTSEVVRYWKSQPFKKGLFKTGWHPPHPTFFAKKECYIKYGTFRKDFRIAADYELMLRFLEKYELSSAYIPKVLIKMRAGGTSNKNIKNIIQANFECYKAWKVNGMFVSPFIIFKKPLSKILQLLK